MQEIDDFNGNIVPQLRTLFTNQSIDKEDLEKFIKKFKSIKGQYVIFKKIPPQLQQIITPEHAYWVSDDNGSHVNLGLDNDFSHWISKSYIRLCPEEEVKCRSIYPPL